MNQIALQLEPVRARKRDPETSQEAASRVRDFASGHYAKIMRALRDGGPGTYREIADRCGLERHAVARRLGEMGSLGVYRTDAKRDGMAVWGIK